MRLRTLRSRLLLAAALWTAGLSVAAVVLSTGIMLAYPAWPRIMHGTAWSHATLFLLIAIAFMTLGLVQLRSGLSPVDRLRARLAAVREGRERRIEGTYPNEVQPLVDDLNALLEHRERTVARAVARAGDLAHGLKTPLAVLAHEADSAAREGHAELGEAIAQQVERMRRQTEYHLAQARAAASGATPGARCTVIESAEALVRTLTRLHTERGLEIALQVEPSHSVRCQREDLDEMLGNLLDNACKWARSQVVLRSVLSDSHIRITVDDDGAGLDAGKRADVLQRGVRADEAAPGSGLGLAIVRDLAELYGGSISLEDAPTGGLRAALELPA